MNPVRTIVLNLGGEGEPIDAGLVLNVNLMWPALLVRPDFVRQLTPGQLAVAASAARLPFADAIADRVVARCFPIQFGHLVDGHGINELAQEVARVLRTDGSVEFHCSSCDVQQMAAAFQATGLDLLQAPRPGYPLILRKWRI